MIATFKWIFGATTNAHTKYQLFGGTNMLLKIASNLVGLSTTIFQIRPPLK